MKIIDFHSLLDTDFPEEPLAPIPLNGCELEHLISPISSEEFVNSYFARTSMNVEGQPNKFDHIFNWGRLRQALARGEKIRDSRYNITASFASGEESGSSRRMMEAHHNQVTELLNAGATICITNIHMADPSLARWANSIRAQLNFSGTVGINCYVSADGSGLPMHYDKRIATTLQIAGKKIWRFSTKPAMAWPDSNEVYQEGVTGSDVGQLPGELEFREVELGAGDLLCLPAGAWHSARGVGYSLALNLYFAPRNLLSQFMPLLQEFAASNEDWRGGPPATAEKIQGRMPENVFTYMRERLDEFYKMARDLIDSPDALTESWLKSFTHNPYTGWQADPLLPVPEVTASQKFCVAASPIRFVETEDNVVLPCDNGVLKMPLALVPVLNRLASEKSFTIPEVLSWQQTSDSTSNETVAYLKALYSNRIIKLA
jgi:ribosomal protein L16 Arg81 hydroxylase